MCEPRKGLNSMKLINYDHRELIMNNVRSVRRQVPSAYTNSQYRILCNLIKQKKITKQFFDFLLEQIYEISDWKQLNYEQMYALIHILTYFDYKKVRM